jgi:hypothetical protein
MSMRTLVGALTAALTAFALVPGTSVAKSRPPVPYYKATWDAHESDLNGATPAVNAEGRILAKWLTGQEVFGPSTGAEDAITVPQAVKLFPSSDRPAVKVVCYLNSSTSGTGFVECDFVPFLSAGTETLPYSEMVTAESEVDNLVFEVDLAVAGGSPQTALLDEATGGNTASYLFVGANNGLLAVWQNSGWILSGDVYVNNHQVWYTSTSPGTFDPAELGLWAYAAEKHFG